MNAGASQWSRRAMLVSSAAAGMGFAVSGEAAAAPARAAGGRVRLVLPPPSGPYRVGTVALRMVDRARRDPWTSTPRELMVSLWYPAAGGGRRAPWLPPAAARLYKQRTSEGLRVSLDGLDLPVTHAVHNAPVQARGGGYPVVVFSPGYRSMRALGTVLAEELASRGYAVVTLDHTHEAQLVEFPGGRLVQGRLPAEPDDADIALALRVRCQDTGFVLDELALLNAVQGLEHRRTPQGLCGALDLSRVGMFGHSLGGATAAEAMARDARIRAGADLDGSVVGPAARRGTDRPFLLMASAGHTRDSDPSWALFWSHLRGWRRQLLLRESGHQAFTDLAALVPQLIDGLPLSPPVAAALNDGIGTVDAARAIAAQRAYLTAFFDLHLQHHDTGLWTGASPHYPEIEFVLD